MNNKDILAAYKKATGFKEATIEEATDSFFGAYDTLQDFIIEYLEFTETHIPAWIKIDYNETWKCELRFSFDTVDYNNKCYIFDK